VVKVAVCQMRSDGTAEQNLKKMCGMAENAVRENVDLILFPEFAYYYPNDLTDSQKHMENQQGRLVTTFREFAAKHKVNILPGTFSEKVDGYDKPFNGTVFIGRKGDIIGSYRKIHLCVMMGYDESEYVNCGDKFSIVDSDIGKIGVMICYDIRFPEHARRLVLDGADFLLLPSAFSPGNIIPMRTSHWDTLTKAAALQNTVYLVAANQFGKINEDYFMGLTRVIDPWGTVVAESNASECIIYALLDFDYQKTVREKLAVFANRRPDLY